MYEREGVGHALRMSGYDEINYENISTIICCTNMNVQCTLHTPNNIHPKPRRPRPERVCVCI